MSIKKRTQRKKILSKMILTLFIFFIIFSSFHVNARPSKLQVKTEIWNKKEMRKLAWSHSYKFIDVIGKTLNKNKIPLPSQLYASLNIVSLGLKREHQKSIETWNHYLRQLQKKYTDLEYVKIIVLNNFIRIFLSGIIEGKMRKRVKDYQARKHQILLYKKGKKLLASLKIKNKKTIALFLVDKKGIIYWGCRGNFSIQKGKKLLNILQKLSFQRKK